MQARDVALGFVISVCLLACRTSEAVFVFDEGSFGSTQQAPTNGWSHVGEVNGGSGVYLGNGFVIVPAHVGVGNLDLFSWDGTTQSTQTFQVDSSFSPCSVQNPSDPMSVWNLSSNTITIGDPPVTRPISTNTDLIVYRLATTPSLPSLVIPSISSPAVLNETVTLISTGKVADPSSGASPGVSIGPGTNRLRWGSNQVAPNNQGGTLVFANSGSGDVLSFFTTFDDPSGSGIATEAQAQEGDSGGAVFRSGTSTLLGIIHAIDGDPDETAFGDQTFMTSLPHYLDYGTDPNNSITSCMATAVPEANSASWLGLCLLFFAGARWRQRMLSRSEDQ